MRTSKTVFFPILKTQMTAKKCLIPHLMEFRAGASIHPKPWILRSKFNFKLTFKSIKLNTFLRKMKKTISHCWKSGMLQAQLIMWNWYKTQVFSWLKFLPPLLMDLNLRLRQCPIVNNWPPEYLKFKASSVNKWVQEPSPLPKRKL